MRLRNLFHNNRKHIEKQVHDLFEIEGTVNVGNVGNDLRVNVEGSLKIKEKKKIESLPFRFGVISENLDIMNAGLKTLEGMPISAGIVSVSHNEKLLSLEGCKGLACKEFNALGLKIKNLEHCPSAISYDFDECPLVSLQGLRTERLESLKVDSQSLVDIKPLLEKQKRDVSKVDITLSYHVNMPLIYLTLLAGQDGFFPITIEEIPTNVERILTPYKGKGIIHAIDLGTKLIDLGYKNNARLR
jgi:hypothetical protein